MHTGSTLYIVLRVSPFTREEGSGQLCVTSLYCRLSSGQAVQGVTSNSMLIVVNGNVFLRCAGRTIRRAPYNAILLHVSQSACVLSMKWYCMSMHVICGEHTKKIVANVHKTAMRSWPDPSLSLVKGLVHETTLYIDFIQSKKWGLIQISNKNSQKTNSGTHRTPGVTVALPHRVSKCD